jgi:agmatine deiminase
MSSSYARDTFCTGCNRAVNACVNAHNGKVRHRSLFLYPFFIFNYLICFHCSPVFHNSSAEIAATGPKTFLPFCQPLTKMFFRNKGRTGVTTVLPAEWEEQDGVLLAWPHERSDWQPILDQVAPVFGEVIAQVSRRERVLLVATEAAPVAEALEKAGACMENIRLFTITTNDTWARDFGPLIVREPAGLKILDFGFNGWGLKFPAHLDNRITQRLCRDGAFADLPLLSPGLILEGGSIESDGNGTILTTSACLLSPNRNPHLSRRQVEEALHNLLGARRVLWLDNGYLAGDDTDSHIDTLARLCPDDTIVHVACDDPADEHYAALRAMTEELRQFTTDSGIPYRLLPLPWPKPKLADDGHRLPATYANFLVINGAVLVPTYRDEADAPALETVGRAFPGREIIGIDCLPLIEQHGSLHCITMQIPRGALA